jgi:hypothetical protein
MPDTKSLKIFYLFIYICLFNKKDVTVQDVFDIARKQYNDLTIEYVQQVIDTICGFGFVVKKQKAKGLPYMYNFFSLLNSETFADFPDGTTIIAESKGSLQEWLNIMSTGIQAKFPQDANFYPLVGRK